MALAYQIERSRRASRARIIVTADKVRVVAPVRMRHQDIVRFVHAKQEWINAATLKLQSKLQAIERLAPENYAEGALIPYQGKHYPLTIQTASLKRIKVEFEHAFRISLPSYLSSAEHQAAIKAALATWLKQSCKSLVEACVTRHAPRHQLTPGNIRIKTQKSRWGSCGVNNDININWLLVLAPPEILEYVVVHELCHIQIRNHSNAFWALVAAHIPDFQRRRNWLKTHGASLMRGL